MSALPGGAADKLGNRYEDWWTLYRLTDVLMGRAVGMRVEPPGEMGTGIEFSVDEVGGRWCEQVKDAPAKGVWTLGRLRTEGVLSSLAGHLARGHSVRLVASTPAAALQALSSRSRVAETVEEYRELLSSDQKVEFVKVAAAWDADDAVAWRYLRHMYVEHQPPELLRRLVYLRYEQLVQGDSELIVGFLRDWLTTMIHQRLTAPKIWAELLAKGFPRRYLVGDPDTLAALAATVDRHRRRIDQARPALVAVHQPQVARLVEWFTTGSARQVLVLHGRAGSGKSTVASDALRQLTSTGWFGAVIRMDAATPGAQTAAALGRAFDLAGSPIILLGGVADGSPAVLLVDQLDAVSTYSGRMPDAYEGVAELLEQAASSPHIKIVLVVRTVDLTTDPRLRSLLADDTRVETLAVGDLDLEQVQAALETTGIDPASLTGATLQLLRVPLHLAVFSRLSQASQSVQYRTLPDLFDRYTDEVRCAIEQRVGALDWSGITGVLMRWMSDREVLQAPAGVLDAASRREVGALTSSGILTVDSGRVGFFHETYFDYLFARAFVSQGLDLHDFLVGSSQHLFRRAQTRQVLEYLTARDRDAFRNMVVRLLTSEAIRPHLRDVVVTVLRQLDPDAEDWRVVEPLAFSDAWYGRRLAALLSAPRWFDAADAAGRWEGLLADSSTVQSAARQLGLAARDRPQRAEQLIRPYIGTSEQWRLRIRTLIEWSLTPNLTGLAVELIERGELDDARGPIAVNSSFWSIVDGLHAEDPAAAARLIGAHLRRALVRARDAGTSDPFTSGHLSTSSSGGASVIEEVATAAPAAFVDEVLPFIVDVVDTTATADRPQDLRSDARWRRRFGGHRDVGQAVFSGAESALRLLARDRPREASAKVQSLADSDTEQLRFLACRTYAAGAAGNDALDWLLSDERNFHLGWTGIRHWVSRELVQVASRHCDDEHLDALTGRLLDHYPDWEKTVTGYRFHGRAQFDLLSAVEPTRRSDRVARRLGELERKFAGSPPAPPQVTTAQFVGPPIPANVAARLTDRNWGRAIRKYRSEGTDWSRGDRPIGGATQLAQLLGTQAEAEPERFARLALTFDTNTHPAYLSSVIEGVAGAIPVPLLAQLCSHARSLTGQAVGRVVCDAVATVGTDADDALLGLLEQCATDEDPRRETTRTPASAGQSHHAGDLLSAGLSSTRGAAARAVAHILFAGSKHADRLIPTVTALAADPVLAVRTWAAEAVTALMDSRPKVALGIASSLFGAQDIDIFNSDSACRLLHIALIREPRIFTPQLRRALNGPEPVAERAGQVWAGAFVYDLLTVPMPMDLQDLSAAARRGAAAAFAADPTVAPAHLISLFNDADPKTRGAATSAIRAIADIDPATAETLLAGFTGSIAFQEDCGDLFFALERSTRLLPEATMAACERAVKIGGEELGDIRSHRVAPSSDIASIVLRLYRQGDAATRDRCIDVIDELSKVGAYGLEVALEVER